MESHVGLLVDAVSGDPAVGLRAVASLRALLEEIEACQVSRAHSLGWSAQAIAQHLDVTVEAVIRKIDTRSEQTVGEGPDVIVDSPTW